ncbi:MAG: transposase [candidate division NC10 bacterium]|nr:transposase [candidate division NC10 bacterium]
MTTTAKAKPVEKVEMDEIRRIIERAKAHLSEEEHRKLTAAIETLAFLTSEIEDKRTTIRRLRKLLFGSTSEKIRDVLDEDASEGSEDPVASPDPESGPPEEGGDGEWKPQDQTADPGDGSPAEVGKAKRPGHGRNGADEYVGARQIDVPHESLKPGDPCPVPNCEGRVYRLADPAVLVRIVGGPPISGAVWRLERLRCGLCLTVFTAKAPDGVGEEKYDATAVSMMVILRYGTGFPLNRLDVLQANLGVPLPASTQWDIAAEHVAIFLPVFLELIRQAAQGQILYNDDTTMKILELMKAARERAQLEEESDRTGMFTSGIVAEKEGIRIALFFTGWKHAGENLATVLAEREAGLQAPIQMCDALARNVPKEFETILSNCMSHARRQVVDVVADFPEECRFVLETLAEVFKNDATARKEGMSPQERLELHRRESLPLMAKLRLWTWREIKERRIEPNSGLGKAIRYMRNHWRKLVRFLYVAGAPLSNNLCERILKKAIIHRKNSLFYKTRNGARVGDIYMSLIATCQLAGVNPFDYLTELQRHADRVRANPGEWLPWNYKATLAAIAEAAAG